MNENHESELRLAHNNPGPDRERSALFDGVVTALHGGVTAGDMSGVNFVQLDWLNDAELAAFMTMGAVPDGKYRTKYLHLDKKLNVSLFQWVPQGRASDSWTRPATR